MFSVVSAIFLLVVVVILVLMVVVVILTWNVQDKALTLRQQSSSGSFIVQQNHRKYRILCRYLYMQVFATLHDFDSSCTHLWHSYA